MKAHRLVYNSTRGWSVMKKKKKCGCRVPDLSDDALDSVPVLVLHERVRLEPERFQKQSRADKAYH